MGENNDSAIQAVNRKDTWQEREGYMDQWFSFDMFLYLYKRILVCYKGVFNGADSTSSDCILPSQERHPFLIIIISIVTIVIGVVKVDWSAWLYPPLIIHI